MAVGRKDVGHRTDQPVRRVSAQLRLRFGRLAGAAAAILITLMATPASSDDSEVLALPLEAAKEYWRINEIQMPEELIEAEAEEDGGCVVIGFIIEADGSTSSHQPVFAWPNDRLVDDAVRAVAQATFKPTRQNKERLPVYTTHTLMTTEQLAGRPDLTTLNMLVVDHCNKRTRQHWEELQGNSESR